MVGAKMCLLLGDFNARVGSIAADCLENMRLSLRKNGERMRELLTENNMVALNTFFPGDPHTWTKVTGRPARLDYIFASTDLLTATRWAGVRKDIDVRVGSVEDHWPVVADVHLSVEDSRETKRKQAVAIDRNLVRDPTEGVEIPEAVGACCSA